jgi:hypothetical protein
VLWLTEAISKSIYWTSHAENDPLATCKLLKKKNCYPMSKSICPDLPPNECVVVPKPMSASDYKLYLELGDVATESCLVGAKL